jgi:hypothetical protein
MCARQILPPLPAPVTAISIRTTAALPGTGCLPSADIHLQERTVKTGFEVIGFGSWTAGRDNNGICQLTA